ncbi:olfactory receptor 14C36-like [Tamandua tetradactyla]|uniref:olfactory receptor 14C36-like n=1 Tax=Tamandua tetradactyla TaxID=48850 RepID=UPI0040548C33
MPNSSMVTEFLLARFSDVWEFRVLHAMLFLLMYLGTLMGNFLIITVIIFDKKLHTPMYFFLMNLSVLDMCCISVTVPKACVIFLIDNRMISIVGCAAQVFFVYLCASTELLFLTVMAHDRYVAICQPLHYPVIMNPQVCVRLMLASVSSGAVFAGLHTGYTFHLSFCQSNVVHQFFCEVPSLWMLSCSDTLSNEILNVISVVVVPGGCFAFITMSYIHIFSTVLKFPNSRDRKKAFSTCVPHILVVTIFVSSIATVYMQPTSHSPTLQGKITSVFYSIVPPFVNPIIYSLRNKQIKESLKRLTNKKTSLRKLTDIRLCYSC